MVILRRYSLTHHTVIARDSSLELKSRAERLFGTIERHQTGFGRNCFETNAAKIADRQIPLKSFAGQDLAASCILRESPTADTPRQNVRFWPAISPRVDSHGTSAHGTVGSWNHHRFWNRRLADTGSSRVRNSPATGNAPLYVSHTDGSQLSALRSDDQFQLVRERTISEVDAGQSRRSDAGCHQRRNPDLVSDCEYSRSVRHHTRTWPCTPDRIWSLDPGFRRYLDFAIVLETDLNQKWICS